MSSSEMMQGSEMSCFKAFTSSWMDREEPDSASENDLLDRKELQELTLFFRGEDGYENITEEEVLSRLCSEAPPFSWQSECLIYEAGLDDFTQDSLRRYVNYGYSSINSNLRKRPEREDGPDFGDDRFLIQDAIYGAPPLPRDITVYRFAFNLPYNTQVGEVFRSLGYLSTTIDPHMLIKNCKSFREKAVVMEIHVSAGRQGLYVPGYESEIIFPHDIELTYLGERIIRANCKKTKETKILVFQY